MAILRSTSLLVVLTIAMSAALSAEPAVPPDHAGKMAEGLELFKSKVRGLLVEHCVKCHGGEKTKGEFDITTREALLKGGADGVMVVPGKARDSQMYKMIAHTDEPYMPEKKPKLPDDAIAAITSWIDAGAPYDKPLIEKAKAGAERAVTDADREFWSFKALKRQSAPEVKQADWCRTPVDRFVLAKLESKGLKPNPIADRQKLIRRAYLDLIGLPPTPEDIQSFINDPAPDAYDKLVDKLLASEHYGERWGRHWLDLARFAESHGYEQDYDRPTAYPYRDFVIQALNEDMPYDRFVKLQLAGDEFEPDNAMALAATGFVAAGTHATQITANQVEKERYDELDDMTSTVGTSLLGMTIGCARCHDHKYDPIPTRDYYRMISTFTTTVRSDVDLDFHPEKTKAAKAEFDRLHAPLVAAREKFEKEQLPARFEEWLKHDPQPPKPRWMILELTSIKSAGGATFSKQEDGSYLAGGTNAKFDTYTATAQTTAKGITAVKLEALSHSSFVKGGPGRASNGNFALTDFTVMAAPIDGKSPPVQLKLVNPKASFEQKGLPITAAIDNDKKSAWAIDPQFGKDHAAVFEIETPEGFTWFDGTTLTFTLKFENNDGHQIGRPRFSISTAPKPATLDGEKADAKVAMELAGILTTPVDKRTPQQIDILRAWYKTTDPEWQKLNNAVQDHLKNQPKPELTKVMVATEGLPAIRFHTQGADFSEKTYFLKRGDLSQKNGEAPQGFMQVLMTTPEQEKHWQVAPPKGWRTSYRRLSMANWITDTQCGAGHLLARVIVNRLWQHHLGRGIVSTPSDFGAQGDRPTHPELLDYLASELIQQGWHLKAIHKLILTSSTYMQNSDHDDARYAIDPENSLYWRRSRHRLEAEIIRDSMLAVSGTLDSHMFGPGSLDDGQKRRSIYFTTKRSKLIPLMSLFDAPDSLQSLGSRSSTTIAPQAMALMNNPQVRSYAHSFAQHVMPKMQAAPPDAIKWAYLQAVGRQPDADELANSLTFISQQSEAYKNDNKSDAKELALTDFCQALMCLNEFIYDE